MYMRENTLSWPGKSIYMIILQYWHMYVYMQPLTLRCTSWLTCLSACSLGWEECGASGWAWLGTAELCSQVYITVYMNEQEHTYTMLYIHTTIIEHNNYYSLLLHGCGERWQKTHTCIYMYTKAQDTSLVVKGDAKSKHLPPLSTLPCQLVLCYLRLEVRTEPGTWRRHGDPIHALCHWYVQLIIWANR